MGVDRRRAGGSRDHRGSAPPLILERIERWDTQAESALRSSMAEDRDSLIESVNAGRVELWKVNRGALWLITRVELPERELIVCCAEGRGLRQAGHALYRIAQKQGLRGIRFFSSDPRIAMMFRKLGVRAIGTVYRCELPHVTQ